MTTVGAYEAKTNLPRLLEQVEAGDTVTITRHGREIAQLVPVSPRPAPPTEVIAAVRGARLGVRLGRGSVRRVIDDGRRR